MARILSTALISLAVFTFAAMASPVIVEKRLAPQKGFDSIPNDLSAIQAYSADIVPAVSSGDVLRAGDNVAGIGGAGFQTGDDLLLGTVGVIGSGGRTGDGS